MCKKFRHPALASIVTAEERKDIERTLAFRAEFAGASRQSIVVLNHHVVEIDDYLQKRKIADSLDKLFKSCDESGRWEVVRELVDMFKEVENEESL